VLVMIKAPQFEAARHILIETLLKTDFETKLIAFETWCTVCHPKESILIDSTLTRLL
jgi:hypothetical protein